MLYLIPVSSWKFAKYLDSLGLLISVTNSQLSHIEKGAFTWEQLVSGWNEKKIEYNWQHNKIYELFELYANVEKETNPNKLDRFLKDKSVIDYIDASESENALIATNYKKFQDM